MKKVLTLLLMFGLSFAAFAQMVDPVKFTAKLEMLKGDEAQIVFSGKIDNGWHVYSTELGNVQCREDGRREDCWQAYSQGTRDIRI